MDGGDEGIGGVEPEGLVAEEADLVVHAIEAGVVSPELRQARIPSRCLHPVRLSRRKGRSRALW
jgi:hypothetical protein